MQNNILVVEDSKTINNTLKNRLEKLGYKVDQSFTFAQAKDMIHNNSYMLIVLDLHLPDGEGYELIDDIHSLTDTKVVILTSNTEEQLREELFKHGILDYIEKDRSFLYAVNEIHKTIQNLKLSNKRKILVIDDSRFVIKQIKTVLEPRNYTIISSLTAKDGLEKTKKEIFDLIVLDMELPDMHGLDVLSELRMRKNYMDVPIIVLSGSYSPATVRRVLKGGGNDFIKKPFIVEEFVLKVDLLINNNIKEQIIIKKSEELKEVNLKLQEKIDEAVRLSLQKDRAMFQQSRLAQMGEMINMIAHQWRQPLSAINNASLGLKMKAQLNKIDKENVISVSNNIINYVQHLNNTIEDFRNFFKANKEKVLTNYNEIVNSVFSIIEASVINNNIRLIKDLRSEKNFKSFANELKQVILNLIKNADEALVQNGIKNPYIEIKTYDSAKECILEVRDNAGGVPPKIMDNIFDMYFTTKGEKSGTGLGLYMSKIIVEEHCGGKLEVENENDGAVFRIVLQCNSED